MTFLLAVLPQSHVLQLGGPSDGAVVVAIHPWLIDAPHPRPSPPAVARHRLSLPKRIR
jgi:hypothetical protein